MRRPSRRLLLGLVAALAVVGLGVGLLRSGGDDAGAVAGKQAPALSGAGIDGAPLDLDEVGRGRPTLVNFWATWCQPCRAEFPRLRARESEVAILGVNVRDSSRLAREFVAQQGATWPSLADPDGELATRWGVGQGLPVTVALDADGVVRARHFGEASDADLAALILAATAPPRP